MKTSYQYHTAHLVVAFLLMVTLLPPFADARIADIEWFYPGDDVSEEVPIHPKPAPPPPNAPTAKKSPGAASRTCKTYSMSHADENYETEGITTNYLAWGLHAFQWLGYNHVHDVPGGGYDEDRIIDTGHLPMNQRPDNHQQRRPDDVITISDMIGLNTALDTSLTAFTQNGVPSDPPKGFFEVTKPPNVPKYGAIEAAMNMYLFNTPTYVDGFGEYFVNGCKDLPDTFCANRSTGSYCRVGVEDECGRSICNGDSYDKLPSCANHDYFTNGCQNLSDPDAFCASRHSGSWCRSYEPVDDCGRNFCQNDDETTLYPCDAKNNQVMGFEKAQAFVLKKVELCVSGPDYPHVKCGWDNGSSGGCNAEVEKVIGGVFYGQRCIGGNSCSSGPMSLYKDDVVIPWGPYQYGNVRGDAKWMVYFKPA